MAQRRLVFGILVGLLILGVLSAWNASAQQDAWTQGYLIGRLSAGGESNSTAALIPFLYPGFQGGFSRAPFGFIFPLLFLVLGVILISRFLRFRAWRYGGGPEGGQWAFSGPRSHPWGDERGPEAPQAEPWGQREYQPRPPSAQTAPRAKAEPGPSGSEPSPTSYT